MKVDLRSTRSAIIIMTLYLALSHMCHKHIVVMCLEHCVSQVNLLRKLSDYNRHGQMTERVYVGKERRCRSTNENTVYDIPTGPLFSQDVLIMFKR